MNEVHDDEGGWGSLADELGLDETKPAQPEKQDEEIVDDADGEPIGEAPELLDDDSEEGNEGEAEAAPVGENGEAAPGKKKRRRRRRGKKKESGDAPVPGVELEGTSVNSDDEAEDDEDVEPVSAMDEENVAKPSFANVVAWKDLVATLHRPH